jgi:hypothetical protein
MSYQQLTTHFHLRFPNLEPSAFVINGQVIANALASSPTFILRTNSVPVVIFPHWSEPPFATDNCILYVNDKNQP